MKKYDSPELSKSTDPEFNGSDNLLKIEEKGIWIQHGFLAGLGSIFTYPTFGQVIKHHWTEIQTDNGYYCVQFHGGANQIQIHKKYSKEDIIKDGKKAAGVNENTDKTIYCVSSVKSVKQIKNMNDVKMFAQSYAAEFGHYNLLLNNCQDFSKELYKWGE